MTTEQPAPPRRTIGVLALAVFVAMAVLLQWKIAPLSADRFLPQAAFGGYTNADLHGFAMALAPEADAQAWYGRLLMWIDPAFILLFGIWIALSFRRRWVGIVLGLTYGVIDLIENVGLMWILSSFWASTDAARADGLSILVSNDNTAALAPFTVTKLMLAVGLVVVVLGRDWVARRQT